jgi:hypothetical protein
LDFILGGKHCDTCREFDLLAKKSAYTVFMVLCSADLESKSTFGTFFE